MATKKGKTGMSRRIKELMDAAELRNSDVAELLDVSTSAVSKWVLGNNRPRGARLDALADLLGVPKAYLTHGNQGKQRGPQADAEPGEGACAADDGSGEHVLAVLEQVRIDRRRLRRQVSRIEGALASYWGPGPERTKPPASRS